MGYQLSHWLWPAAQLCNVLEVQHFDSHSQVCGPETVCLSKRCWFGIFNLYACLPTSQGSLNVRVVAALALPIYKYSLCFFPRANEQEKKKIKNYCLQESSAKLRHRHSHKLGWVEERLAHGLWDKGQTWHVPRWWIVRIALPNHVTKILVLCASALYLFTLLFESARMKPAASAVLHVECYKICGWYDWIQTFVPLLMFCFRFVEFYTLFSEKEACNVCVGVHECLVEKTPWSWFYIWWYMGGITAPKSTVKS